MYKTIRQGENSLQYTILPQQDEGRAGPSVVHRRNGGSRKKSILAYIGLFFICTIITFAILIPLMVTSDLMPTPSWFYRHNNQQKVRDFRNPVNVKMSIQENHIIKGTPLRTIVTSTTTNSPSTTTTTQMVPTEKPAVHSSPLWTDALSVTEFQNLYKSDESMEQIKGALNEDVGQEVIPTSTMRPQTTVNLFLSRARLRMTTTNSPIRPSLPSRNYPKHFSLQKHEKTPAPELTMAAVIPQETKAIQVDTNTEDMAQVHQNWLRSYVDPYLQWRVRIGFICAPN